MPKVKITKLEYERRCRGWSQSELARRADLNASSVSAFENLRLVPYEGQAEKLGRALGLPKAEWSKLQESVVNG